MAEVSFSSQTFAQNQPNSLSSPTPQETIGSDQIIELKDGRKISFKEIAEKTGAEKDTILDDLMTDVQVKAFQAWRRSLIQAANQEADAARL